MRKAIVVAAVVGVALAAIVWWGVSNLERTLNENRDWIEAQAEAALGRPIAFRRIGVSLGWGLAVRVEDLRVDEDPAFGQGPFATAEAVEMGVQIWPALFGRYEVDHLLVEAPEITVVLTADGINVATLGSRPEAPPPPAPSDPTAPGDTSSGEPAPDTAALLAVALARIENGTLRILDRRSDPPLEIVAREVQIHSADLRLGAPVEAQLSALVTASLPAGLSVNGPISAHVTLDPTPAKPAVRARIDATELAVSTGETFRKPAGTPLRLQMQASLDGDTVTLSDGTFTLANAEVAYEGTVTTAPTVAYDLHLRSQSLPLSGWESILPALADLVLAGEADVDLRVAGSVEQAGLPPLYGTVTLRDLTVRVDGVPELTKLSAAIQLEGDRATLPKSALELGGSPLELEATVANFDAPDLTFAITSKVLQASSILLGDPHSVKPEVLRGVDLRGTASLPAGAGLRLKADLRSSDGSIRDLDYRDLRADFVYRDERATLENASLRALDGELSLAGVYDLRDPETPAFELRTTAVEIRLEQALASQFPGAARVIEGRLSGDIDLTGRGSEWDVIKQFLRGGGTLELEAGVLRGINLAESVLTSVSVVPVLGKLVSAPIKTAYPAIFGEPHTVFETIGGKIEIADGRLHTPNLRFEAVDYKIRADGSISLDADVSLTGTFIAGKRLTDHLIGRAGPLRHLTGGSGKIQIPFRLEGPATRLKVRPDVHYVTKALRRGLEENLVGQAVKGLEGLLQKK